MSSFHKVGLGNVVVKRSIIVVIPKESVVNVGELVVVGPIGSEKRRLTYAETYSTRPLVRLNSHQKNNSKEYRSPVSAS